MGRKITDGKAIDVVAPSSTLVSKGELYRISNFTGFAMDTIEAADTERSLALERTESLWRVKVPAGTCGTRGIFVKWADNTGAFQKGDTNIVDETVAMTVLSVAQVESVRNSDGYATLKLVL